MSVAIVTTNVRVVRLRVETVLGCWLWNDHLEPLCVEVLHGVPHVGPCLLGGSVVPRGARPAVPHLHLSEQPSHEAPRTVAKVPAR